MEAIWAVGMLVTLELSAERTDGRAEICEYRAPAGYGPPLHVHDEQAEFFRVLEGRVRFRLGDDERVCGPGESAFLPAGVPHTFLVEGGEEARMLHVCTPPGLWAFHRELGEPAPELRVPPPGPVDVAAGAAAAARHGMRVVGPPLSALAAV